MAWDPGEQAYRERTILTMVRAKWIAECLNGHVGPDENVVLNGFCFQVDSSMPPEQDLARIRDLAK